MQLLDWWPCINQTQFIQIRSTQIGYFVPGYVYERMPTSSGKNTHARTRSNSRICKSLLHRLQPIYQRSILDMPYAATGSSSFYPKGANAQPYFGVVENTVQALRLVYAVRLGTVPSIIRRLNDAERKEKIISGAVFVFCVEESGMKRWTDGRNWSPSRIDGNFLVSSKIKWRCGDLTCRWQGI